LSFVVEIETTRYYLWLRRHSKLDIKRPLVVDKLREIVSWVSLILLGCEAFLLDHHLELGISAELVIHVCLDVILIVNDFHYMSDLALQELKNLHVVFKSI